MNLFWIITIATQRGQATVSGIRTAPEGDTREETFNSIFKYALEQTGYSTATVLFFTLEPNQLSGAQ